MEKNGLLLIANYGSELVATAGALATNAAAGGRTHALILLTREPSRPDLEKAAKVIGCTVEFADLPYGDVSLTYEQKRRVVKTIREFQPDVVLMQDPEHVWHDLDPDRRIGMMLTLEALALANRVGRPREFRHGRSLPPGRGFRTDSARIVGGDGCREEMNLSYLFITHDLGVARYACQAIGVMYNGRLVERGLTEEIIRHGQHPYTRALLAVVIDFERFWERRTEVVADRERSEAVDKGCGFAPRCPCAVAKCREVEPQLRLVGTGHAVACHYAVTGGC